MEYLVDSCFQKWLLSHPSRILGNSRSTRTVIIHGVTATNWVTGTRRYNGNAKPLIMHNTCITSIMNFKYRSYVENFQRDTLNVMHPMMRDNAF